MEYYPTIKKNERMPLAATWMDLETVVLSHKKKDKRHHISFTYGIYKMIQMNLFTKQTHRHRKQTYGYQKGKKGRDKLGIWD